MRNGVGVCVVVCIAVLLCVVGCDRTANPTNPSSPSSQRVAVECYLFDNCGSCNSGEPGCGDCKEITDMHRRWSETYGDSATLTVYNMRVDTERDKYLDALAQRDGLSAEERERYPIFYVNDRLFVGEDSWADMQTYIVQIQQGDVARVPPAAFMPIYIEGEEEELPVLRPRNDRGTALGDSDSVVVYFYKTWCPYCHELSPLLDALPQTVTLSDGTSSNVRFLSYDKEVESDMAVVQQYYDALDIPEERQFVPMIIIGERVLFLSEEIVPQLLPALLNGEGRDTPVLE